MIVYCICDCFELLLTSLGRSRKITIQNVALNSTNTAEMQINWKACLHCIIVGARQRKEHLQGVPNSASKRFLIVARCEWIYDNDLALTYTKGAKEEKWGTNCKDPTGKVMKKVKDYIAVQDFKDLSSNLWTKWTAASTSGFSPFSPRWCWWSLWADNWNESRADFNIVAWKSSS